MRIGSGFDCWPETRQRVPKARSRSEHGSNYCARSGRFENDPGEAGYQKPSSASNASASSLNRFFSETLFFILSASSRIDVARSLN